MLLRLGDIAMGVSPWKIGNECSVWDKEGFRWCVCVCVCLQEAEERANLVEGDWHVESFKEFILSF